MLSTSIVLPTIELYDQLAVGAAKVDNKAINRGLPFELPAIESAIAQTEP